MAGESNGWRRKKLSECAEFQEGYVNPSQSVAEYFGNDIKWLRAVDLNDGYVWNTSRRLSKAGFESAGKSAMLFEPDSLCISKSGTIGRLGIIKDYMCGNRAVINIRIDRTRCDSRFIFYTLLSRRAEIEELAGGSVQRNLYCSALGSVEINLPPLSHQSAIGRILGTLDDKIEVNRHMNRALEAMARAIYKSWFVDLDVVRAKAKGRQPAGMNPETFNLFPAEFEETASGKIPKGWSVGSMLMAVDLLSGGTPATSEKTYWDGPIPWASAKDVSQSDDSILLATERSITKEGLENSATRIIPRFSTVVVARGATTGRYVLFGQDMAMNQTCYALKPKEGDFFFVYNWFGAEVEKLVHAAHGSVFDTITTATFSSSMALIPPPEVRKTFHRLVAPMYDRILSNVREVAILASIRNALLPKLLSGELRVGLAEDLVQKATT